ncbi:MerR family transcriptional regulator [Streptacidiphilus anmyonensis]|uniref:MerR family transcriptional regulator n=1 Tax=Streptacidiphilus anmyonensis TaxID=405782 RepID=UPI0005A9C4AB|nr:MerR family transcriptional regulator [Streptacidiphilus anmyonensis]
MNESSKPAAGAREYRTEELARAAGIPVRTLRFYRERRLLPPPRREGRIAFYSEDHLARLRVIADLLERGHTLGGIAELLAAWESGQDVAELLGLEAAIGAPWSQETETAVTAEELAATFPGQVDADSLAASVELGYLRQEGDHFVHVSRRLLDASAELVAEGVPLAAVLATARGVRASADALADQFVELIVDQLLPDLDEPLPPGEPARLAEALARLRDVARTVVDVEFALAMDRRVQREVKRIGTARHTR